MMKWELLYTDNLIPRIRIFLASSQSSLVKIKRIKVSKYKLLGVFTLVLMMVGRIKISTRGVTRWEERSPYFKLRKAIVLVAIPVKTGSPIGVSTRPIALPFCSTWLALATFHQGIQAEIFNVQAIMALASMEAAKMSWQHSKCHLMVMKTASHRRIILVTKFHLLTERISWQTSRMEHSQ